MIYNQPYGMKFIDFVNPKNNTIEELIKVWTNHFNPILEDVLIPQLNKSEFSKRFILKFYNRYIATQTITEFDLRFINFMLGVKEQAERLYNLKNKDLELFFNQYNISKSDVKNKVKSRADNTNINTVKGTITNKNNNTTKTTGRHKGTNNSTHTNDSKHVVADTPADTQNVNNLFTNNNYISNAEHTKNYGKDTNTNITDIKDSTKNNFSGTQKNDQTTDNVNKNINKSKSIQKNNNISYGYNGNIDDLVNAYMNISLDVINFYLEQAENYGLFKKILA